MWITHGPWLGWVALGCQTVQDKGNGDTGGTPVTSAYVCPDGSVPSWFSLDSDGDGFGATIQDPESPPPVEACTAPPGYVLDSTDCRDSDRFVYPGAPELCDGQVNDCDAQDSPSEAGGTFIGALGDVTDLTLSLAKGTATAPVTVRLVDDGTLNLCEGTWYAALVVAADVDVVGVSGPGATTIDVGGLAPAVLVEQAHSVSLAGLTIRNAGTVPTLTGELGGGIACANGAQVEGNDLVLVGSTEPLDGYPLGGVISARDGCQLTVTDSDVIDGTAAYGGQVYVEGASVSFVNATFSGGTAFLGGSVFVGALAASFYQYPVFQPSTFTCDSCTFSDNGTGSGVDPYVSEGKGGALFLYADASAVLTGGSFISNEAGPEGGGAIYIDPSDAQLGKGLPVVTLDETSFVGNLADQAGNDLTIEAKPPVSYVFGLDPQTLTCGPSPVCEPSLRGVP